MTIKLKKVGDLNRTFNLLLYSEPGVGKTYFAASAEDIPELGKVLIANIEGGLLTIADRPDVLTVDIGRNDDGTANGRTAQDLEDLFWAIMRKDQGYEEVKTVVIDSGTELQNSDLSDIVAAAVNNKNTKRSDLDETYQADYGTNTNRLRRVLRLFRDAPINVIITALVRQVYTKPLVKDQPPKLVEVRPAFTEKLGDSVMGFCDFVWYMWVDEKTGERKLLTSRMGVVRAKTRNEKVQAALGQVVDNPTLPGLHSSMMDALRQ